MRYFFALAAFILSFAFAPLVVYAGLLTSAATLAPKTDGLARLFTTRLHLDNTKAAMMRYHLQSQIRSLRNYQSAASPGRPRFFCEVAAVDN